MSHSAKLCNLKIHFYRMQKEWSKLDRNIRNAETYASLRKMLLNFKRPKRNSTYKIYDPLRIKLLTRLRLCFSHLLEHRFKHNFTDSLNPLCSCSLEAESTLYFFPTLPKLHYITRSPYDWFKKYQWNHYVFE